MGILTDVAREHRGQAADALYDLPAMHPEAFTVSPQRGDG
jgi:hypothetical protein